MGMFSNIAWTHHTFNLWIGCTRVSEGCRFCYAETLDATKRFDGTTHWGPGVPRKRMSDKYWNDPLRWNKKVPVGERQRVFCSSLADVFDVEGYADERARFWELTKKTPKLDWLVLTKRPENFKSMLPADWGDGYWNVWLGITTEDQRSADKRIPILAETPARVKWLSVEPQIEEIDFSKWLENYDPLNSPFNWMIFGGESGSDRGFDPEWIRKPMDQVKESGPAVFVKQMGSVWAKANGVKKKADDPDEWPEWCRVREFPKTVPEEVGLGDLATFEDCENFKRVG